jgi:hypothetical protein
MTKTSANVQIQGLPFDVIVRSAVTATTLARTVSGSGSQGLSSFVGRRQRHRKGMPMRAFRWPFLAVALVVGTACNSTPPPQPPAPARLLRPIATIKDIMDSIVDPSADALWQSVATVSSAKGIEDRQPRTDEEWAHVRRDAIRLVEATNLLVVEGRHVARPGEKAENTGVELEPEKIEKLINDDRQAFIELAHGLQDASLPALKAIDAKDADALLAAGAGIDRACESCHLKYWYPDEAQAAAAQQSGAASPRKR